MFLPLCEGTRYYATRHKSAVFNVSDDRDCMAVRQVELSGEPYDSEAAIPGGEVQIVTSLRIAAVVSGNDQLFHKARLLFLSWKRSRILHLLRVFFLATAFGGPAHAEPREFLLCDLALPLPEGLRPLEESSALSEFEGTYGVAGNASWLFSCTPNQRRTSRLSELEAGGTDPDQRVRNLERLWIDQGVEAALFERTRIIEGRRIYSIEAYVATRNVEYRILVVPGGSGGLSLSELHRFPIEGLRSDLGTMLHQARFRTAVEQTITEAEFNRRLHFLIAGCGLLVLLLGLGLVWRLKRRVQRRAAARAVSRSS